MKYILTKEEFEKKIRSFNFRFIEHTVKGLYEVNELKELGL